MNNWEIKKVLSIVLAIQIAVPGFVGLATLGFNIPVLRQVLGFFYITLIPGFLILRILRLRNLSSAELLLYSVGLSLALVMFLGLFANSVFPLIGVSRPISTFPVTAAMTVAVLILCVLAYRRDKSFSTPTQFNWQELLSPPALFLILLPLLSVLGTQMVNLYDSNVLLLTLVAIVALVPVIVTFTNFIPQRLYPLAVLTIALALLFHVTLISNYLIGSDVHGEYRFANAVLTNAVWDTSLPSSYNAMASIVVLAPVYSIVCGMELTWVFKLIYPLLFSLVPLAIYQAYNWQLGSKIAFLATFFFMSVSAFYAHIPTLARTEIATLFLALTSLLIVRKTMLPLPRSALLLVFTASIAISHYTVSYILMGFLVMVLLILLVKGKSSAKSPRQVDNKTITVNLVAFYVVFSLLWYIWQAGGSIFADLVKITEHVATCFLTEFLNPELSEAFLTITTPLPPLHEVTKYLHLFTQFLIGVGILELLLQWRQKKLDNEFSIFSLVNFGCLVAAIVVPYLAYSVQTTRLYHMTLIFLAPFCITGAIAIQRFLFRRGRATAAAPFMVMSIVLAAFLLFNTGFIYEVARDHPNSVSLSQQSIRQYGDAKSKVGFYGYYTPEEEVFSARWLSGHAAQDIKVYATYLDSARVHALESYGEIPSWRVVPLTDSLQELDKGAYVYLQYINVAEGLANETFRTATTERKTYPLGKISHLWEKANKIYSNGGSEIYYVNR